MQVSEKNDPTKRSSFSLLPGEDVKDHFLTLFRKWIERAATLRARGSLPFLSLGTACPPTALPWFPFFSMALCTLHRATYGASSCPASALLAGARTPPGRHLLRVSLAWTRAWGTVGPQQPE